MKKANDIDQLFISLGLKEDEGVKLRNNLAEFAALLTRFKELSGNEKLECYQQLRGYLKHFHFEIFHDARDVCPPEDLKYFYRVSTFKWHPGHDSNDYWETVKGTGALIGLARAMRDDAREDDPFRMLWLCRREDMPEVYDLYSPDAVKEEFRLFAMKRCAPHRIPDLYRKIFPATRMLNLITLERCAADRMEELRAMMPGGASKDGAPLASCQSPMEIPAAYKQIAHPTRRESAHAIERCDAALVPDIYRHIPAPDEGLTLSAVRHCLSSKVHELAEMIARPSSPVIHALIDESDDDSLLKLLEIIPQDCEYASHAIEKCSPHKVPEIIAALRNPPDELVDTAFELCEPSRIVDMVKVCPAITEARLMTAVARCGDHLLTELAGRVSQASPALSRLYRQRLESYRDHLNNGERLLLAYEKTLLQKISEAERKRDEFEDRKETSPFPSEMSIEAYHADGRVTNTNYYLKDTRRELEAVRNMLESIGAVLHEL